jgi:hypothetical protein
MTKLIPLDIYFILCVIAHENYVPYYEPFGNLVKCQRGVNLFYNICDEMGKMMIFYKNITRPRVD